MVIPPRTPTIEPTGGSDGTAVEQAFTAYRKTVSGLNKTQPARNFQTAEANESSGSESRTSEQKHQQHDRLTQTCHMSAPQFHPAVPVLSPIGLTWHTLRNILSH